MSRSTEAIQSLVQVAAGSALLLAGAMSYAGPSAVVQDVEGWVVSEPRGTGDRPLDVGDRLAEGARLQSDPDGRAELLLPDGTSLWIDGDTVIELGRLEAGRGNELTLWRGQVAAHTGRSSNHQARVSIETPGGRVELTDDGRFRVSVTPSGYTHLAVERGTGTLFGAGQGVILTDGLRASVFPREAPESPYRFDLAALDELGRYVERSLPEFSEPATARRRAPLPATVQPYRQTLDEYGHWTWYPAASTHVWVPYTTAGWRPYRDGRWSFESGTNTWIADEPWGYVTHHYGGWDYALGIGWYWIPGSVYAPAWVDWYQTDDLVAWCPSSYAAPRRSHSRVLRDRTRGHYDPARVVVVKRDRLRDRDSRVGDHAIDPARLPRAGQSWRSGHTERPHDRDSRVGARRRDGHDRKQPELRRDDHRRRDDPSARRPQGRLEGRSSQAPWRSRKLDLRDIATPDRRRLQERRRPQDRGVDRGAHSPSRGSQHRDATRAPAVRPGRGRPEGERAVTIRDVMRRFTDKEARRQHRQPRTDREPAADRRPERRDRERPLDHRPAARERAREKFERRQPPARKPARKPAAPPDRRGKTERWSSSAERSRKSADADAREERKKQRHEHKRRHQER